MFGLRIFLLFLLLCTTAAGQVRDTVSLSLDEAIALALEHAPLLQLADAIRDEARASTYRALSPPPPEVSAEYGFIPRGAPVSAYGERSFSIEQSIGSPLSWYFKVREGSALRQKAETERSEALRRYLTDLRMQYWKVAANRLRASVAGRLLRRARLQFDAASTRAAVGEAARDEVIAARTMLARAQLEHERKNAEVEREAIRLAALLGVANGNAASLYLPSDSLRFDVEEVDTSMFLGHVMQYGPSIRAARASLDAARAASSRSTTDLFPSLSFGVMDQRERDGAPGYGFRISATIPLWYAFDQRYEQQVTTAREMQAIALLEATEQAQRSTARALLLAYRMRSNELVRYRDDILPGAETLAELTERAWIAGERSFLDVIQARTHLSTVLDEAAQAALSLIEITTEMQSLLSTEES